MRRITTNDRGLALTVTIFFITILLTLLGAGLFLSEMDLKVTGSHKRSAQAFELADSGIQHSLALIPVGTAFPYGSPLQLIDSAGLPFAAGFDYSVVAVNAAANTQAILTSTSQGPQNSRKVIVAYVGRGGYGFGAVHVPGDAGNIETTFSGNSFSINGTDRCGVASAVPGISITDPALATEITNTSLADGGLDSSQMDNVTGAGGSPSVRVTFQSPTMVSDLASAFLGQIHTAIPGGNYGGNESWGTAASPRITRITGDANIQGTIDGYGVLIIDGALDVSGNFTFNGLVIARGDIEVQFTGNAGIFGSVLLTESSAYDPTVELDVRGNAHIRYDSCALAAADGWVPLPKAARLLAWQEKFFN